MTSNNEIVMNLDNQYLIDVNEKILKRQARIKNVKVYIETTKNIDLVIPTVNSVGNSGNRKEDLIEKAAYIMVVIPWAQAFFDGNRRTGIIAASKFLHDNGYELDEVWALFNSKNNDQAPPLQNHYGLSNQIATFS